MSEQTERRHARLDQFEAALAEKDRRIAQLELEVAAVKEQGHDEFREQNACITRLREHIDKLEAIIDELEKP